MAADCTNEYATAEPVVADAVAVHIVEHVACVANCTELSFAGLQHTIRVPHCYTAL